MSKKPLEGAKEAVGHTLIKVGQLFGIDLDPSAGIIFLTGGSGVVGYRVATRLLRAGHPTIRLGFHHPEKTPKEELFSSAEVADFDWERQDTYAHALKGVKTVFCSPPYVKGWERQFPAFLRACRDAGVKHIVKLSFYHARHKADVLQNVPLIRWHGKCDELLVNSGIHYTILGATHWMSNVLVYQKNTLNSDTTPATFYGSSGNRGVNYVSPNDIAEVAVRSLLEPRAHRNKEYTLTGPQAITDQEVASLLSHHLGKPIMYVDQPLHTFETGEKEGGEPLWMVKDMVALEKVKADGREEEVSFVSKDIETICGHPAQTYDEYLSAADYMTPKEKL